MLILKFGARMAAQEGGVMVRILAWILVVWGVAVWATWCYYLLLGIATPKEVVFAGVGGGVLVWAGYWLKRTTKC